MEMGAAHARAIALGAQMENRAKNAQQGSRLTEDVVTGFSVVMVSTLTGLIVCNVMARFAR